MLLDRNLDGGSPVAQIKSIKSLLSEQRLSSPFGLTARQRYRLAAAIACAVLHAADTPWIHDDWDQEQVSVLLEKDAAQREIVSQHPYISCLFHTQLGPGSQPAQYRFKSSRIRNKTVFALGVLLIELCLNKSFEKLKRDSSMPLTDDFDLADSKLRDVYGEAGDSYGYAVQRCVRFDFSGIDETQKLALSRFQRTFYDGVVAPIQARYFRSSETTI